MKRILSILLCLAMLFTIAACKPDNITYPVEITNPNAAPEVEEPKAEEEAPAAPEAEKAEGEEEAEEENKEPEAEEEAPAENEAEAEPKDEATEEEPKEEEPAEEVEEPKAEEVEEEPAEEEAEKGEEEPLEDAHKNPLAAEDFKPSFTVGSALEYSGIIPMGEAVNPLKDRTITLYSAGEQAAFRYADKKGNMVDEKTWMEQLAEENGFVLKYTIKGDSVSLKSQRVALWAGVKLSLICMQSKDLAEGLSIARSAADYLNMEAESFGISKAVLNQSNQTLFAPVGMINTLWYDPSLLAEGESIPAEGDFTVTQFNALAEKAAERKISGFKMEEFLAWATLSGISPLTLLDGKLDSNINAQVTRNVWSAIGALPSFAAKADETHSLQEGNLLMEYTATPAPAKEQALRYAPLPSLKEGESRAVTFSGVFTALPQYEKSEEATLAALNFAELWCNRYTEARAAALSELGIRGEDYLNYCALGEEQGMLILHSPAIEEMMQPYFEAIFTPDADLQSLYQSDFKEDLLAKIASLNLYY